MRHKIKKRTASISLNVYDYPNWVDQWTVTGVVNHLIQNCHEATFISNNPSRFLLGQKLLFEGWLLLLTYFFFKTY
jgi:hypothetical protein